MQYHIKILFFLLFSIVFLQTRGNAQEDPNCIRDDDGKIVLGITCPDKDSKKTRLIVEGIISDHGDVKLSLNAEQKKEFESYLRSYLESLEDLTTTTPKVFAKDVEQKIKEMLELEKSPKMKVYQFSMTSSLFRSRLPKK